MIDFSSQKGYNLNNTSEVWSTQKTQINETEPL